MEDLEYYRGQIDEIDDKLISLLEARMNVVRKVGAYKMAHNLPVLHPAREEAVLKKAVARLKNPAYEQDAVRFMKLAMELSREAQRRDMEKAAPSPRGQAHRLQGPVGFYGTAGSFTEQAAAAYFGAERERRAYSEFQEIFAALKEGEIDYGVLPIENSSTGGITWVYDLLRQDGNFIVGEISLKISQNLVGLPGTSLEGIDTIYSHSQGIEQCESFLGKHKEWNLVPFRSTATSAKKVAEEKDPHHAAIASKLAAQIYGLEILAPDIQDRKENYTRFIIIGRQMETEHADKVSIMFSLDHASGTLYRTLQYFADRGINLVKIESRPLPDSLWHYLFYLDFEGELDSGKVQEALRDLNRDARYYKLLGAYRACNARG